MAKSVLFIDGENFLHKVKEALKEEKIHKNKIDLTLIDLNILFKNSLKGLNIFRKMFYVSRLHIHPETKEKSLELIKFQRKLRNNLISQNYEFIIAGNIRAQKIGKKVIFKEKGVDVKIGVDLVAMACDKKLDHVILCSSDSDLQPAVAELKQRNIKITYVGFETNPNKGLSYTTNRTILLRNPEIIKACSDLR